MKKRKLIITGASLIVFAILTYVVVGSVAAGTSDSLAFDTAIRQWVYSLRTPWLTEVVKAITFMGNTKTVVAVCVLLVVVPLVIGIVQLIVGKGKRDNSSPEDGVAAAADCSGKPAGKPCNIGFYITKKIGIPIGAVAIIGSAINKIFKHTILRPRPDVSLHLIEQGGWSFPSGHSISGLLLYGFLVWLIRRYVNSMASAGIDTENQTDADRMLANKSRAYCSLFANKSGSRCCLFANIATVVLTVLWIGVGLSRIYLGVHYPTDILGGWTLGMVVMMAAIMIIEKIENKGKH